MPYFGVGNESWGCGGNMRPEHYADLYRQYATFVKSYAKNPVERVACGPSGPDYAWTETLMKGAARQMSGLSLHHYTHPTGRWDKKGSATEFGEDEWHSTFVQAQKMEELVERHSAIMDRYDPERRVSLVVDEWGTWYDAEPGTNPAFLYQESTLRDALVAAMTLGIFCRHAARVRMANLAQTVNVLQAVLLTDGEELRLTPTYHAFEMLKSHQGARLVSLDFESPEYRGGSDSVPVLSAFASRDDREKTVVALVHLDPHRPLAVALSPARAPVAARVLTAPAINLRSVAPAPFRAFALDADRLSVELPARSLVVLEWG